MAKIVIIMGKSSSGKDTIFKKLVEMTNLKKIVPYTTRPIRTGEKEGVDYFYVTPEYFEKHADEVIESRTYNTVHGPWTYGELKDSQINMEDPNAGYILVVTPEAYRGFLKYFGREHLVPIYISLDNGVRLQRALDRERSQDNPKYTELCRRFLADEQDFSEEILKELEINKSFENDNLDEVLDKILKELSDNGVV